MKYGLLYYKDTDNIGDDVQSYAQERFLPHVDYLVDRENLEMFVPDKKEKVKVIMNAWYVHDMLNFDISPYIEPLYISMFLKRIPYKGGITIGTDYLNDNILNSFKKYGPIGTRDMHTKKVLDLLNIPNYFSGCMTLTINKLPDVKKEDYIVVVGLKDHEIEYIKKKTNRKVIKFVQDVERGSFSNESWQERRKRVEDVLRLYQGAHLVITTKLHCSLPCLAIGTPVLLLYDTSFAENEDRIGTYLSYLNYVKREEFLDTDIDFENPKPNSSEYLKLREELEKKCKEFINSEIKEEPLIDIQDYKESLKKSKNMRSLPIKLVTTLQDTYEKECEKSAKMYDEINELKYWKDHYEKLYRQTDEILSNTVDFKLKRFGNKIKKKLKIGKDKK